MGQARIPESGIKERREKIARWEEQILVWEAMASKDPGLEIVRKAINAGRDIEKKEIVSRVLSLQFSTEADRLDLGKRAGTLAAFDSIYYDIFESEKKIEGARLQIARLLSEISKANKGELIDTGAL